MKKLFIAALFFTSCKAIAPGTGLKSGEEYFGIRNVSITCSDSVGICADGSAHDMQAMVLYTTDICQNFTDSSPVVALGSSPVLCQSQSCISDIIDYFSGESPLTSLPAGNYSLVSFIDVNTNSLPDSDEPYLCAHNVQITALKANSDLQVSMVMLRSEALIDDDA